MDPILEAYIFETIQLLTRLEEILLEIELNREISEENIDEIFRIMHTVKGSSGMMAFQEITSVSHNVEDLFFYIRENGNNKIDIFEVCNLTLLSLDFINQEVEKISLGRESDGSGIEIIEKISNYLESLKGVSADKDQTEVRKIKSDHNVSVSNANNEECNYFAYLKFEDECGMENIRAFTVINNISDICEEIHYEPSELLDENESKKEIIDNGFKIYFSTDCEYEKVREILEQSLFVKSISLDLLSAKKRGEHEPENTKIQDQIAEEESVKVKEKTDLNRKDKLKHSKDKNDQGMINVSIEKLDKLLNLVGEIVITEDMVIKNPIVNGLEIEDFKKASRQLKKLTDELQDIVMDIRMIAIGMTFHKMNRVVRDMSKKIGKEVELIISGEETEVDKNVISALGDPLMHLIRNAMDHGLESAEERASKGKSHKGKLYLEASDAGGEVIITVSDDGRGLDREKLIEKAKLKNLIDKDSAEITDKEAYSLILLPGFSTKDSVTEFSGRGVGMDVVRQNIEKIGGVISIDSKFDEGTNVTMKIPLTLAIIGGMQISIGESLYTIPINSIRESFRPSGSDIIQDTNGNEMIMIRGKCYPIICLSRYLNTGLIASKFDEGMLIVIESNNKKACLFVDNLLGEQQVVIKPLPEFLNKYRLKNIGIAGCTILGDGRISLILNIPEIINNNL